jgi:trimeric autotransporter adhesin
VQAKAKPDVNVQNPCRKLGFRYDGLLMKFFSGPLLWTICVFFCSFSLSGCSGGGNSSGGGGGTTTQPAPAVTSISPTKLTAGAGVTVVTITGTNFTSGSTVKVNGVSETTTYVSATQLTASVPASQLASGANLSIVVSNGSTSSPSNDTVSLEVDNPAPVIASFSPSSLLAGNAVTLSISGTGFVPTTTIQVNGTARTTAFVSSTQVTVSLAAADVAASGALSITAVNNAPGGGTSSAASVPVNNPAPTITAISPSSVAAGTTTPTTVTITGTNFAAGSTVMVGTTDHAATVISSSHLTFQLSAAEQAAAGKLAITVVNAGGTSNAVSLTVATAASLTPTLTAVNPASFITGAGDSNLTLSGTNFDFSSVVQWNGAPLVTSYQAGGYGAYLSAVVPAAFLASTGTASVTVENPAAPTPTSNALSVTITNPPVPTLTSTIPGYGAMNTAFQVTALGTGFASTSVVNFNGTPLTTTYNSSTSLSANVPASLVAAPGSYSITVTTPVPGGGTSSAQTFSTYIPLVSNSMIYNPADGMIYASIPGSVGPPMGNSVVSVNPATGAIGMPIFVGSEPDKLALTADGSYLWVGLDGSSSVRKVDLTAKTAGLQFSLPAVNGGIYDSPAKPQALAALPGATDSVVVALSNSNLISNVGLAIFDSGVMRPNAAQNTIYDNEINAIQIDQSKSEIYAGGSGAYDTYTYASSGLTQKVALTNISPASVSQDEMQLLSGKIYTDFGQVYDAEAGALLGTLYATGQTIAQGPTIADATQGKIFTLDNSMGQGYSGYTQIQIFNLNDYTSPGPAIPVNAPYLVGNNSYPSRLVRWGANGLAFHTGIGIVTLQSNLVADLGSTVADLGVTLTSGGSTATGGNTTYTAQITNNGPSTATDVVVTAQGPLTGSVVSAVPNQGSCGVTNGVSCSFGSISSGAPASVTFTVLQATAGTSTMAVSVFGSTTDSNNTNNSATSAVTVTGASYNAAAVLTSISPAAIQTGTTDATLTVNGTGFVSGSTVMLGSTTLSTTFVSAIQLTAIVPASNFKSMGWAPVTVSTPAPGGGTSAPVPLTYFDVLTVGLNHIVYDPYSRNLMASVGSGSSTVTGNSIVAIQPDTATIGAPVPIGSQPTNLALTSDGQILYTILSGSQSVARFNMLTGQVDYTYQIPSNTSFDGGIALRGIAAQPGTENTIALDIASFTGNAIYDFDPVNKTAAIRGQASGPYSGSCISFLDATDLLAFDTDTSGSTLDHYTVTSAGFTYYNYSQFTESTLNNFGCFKLSGGLAFANGGGIADPATVPATQVATLSGVSGGGFSTSQALAPDESLQRAFYPAISSSSYYSSSADGITAFDLSTYLPITTMSLNMPVIEGLTSGYSQVDIVRWGQDGLAILTSTGHIYLLRGAAIVPGLMIGSGTDATLSSVSSTTLSSGSGNVLLTVTGSNFAPGVAVTWNGSYRTTTIVDATHVTVAIPASDLASPSSATIVATNPASSASNSLQITIN